MAPQSQPSQPLDFSSVGGVSVPASDPNSNSASGQKPALDFSSVGGKPVVGQNTDTDKQDPSLWDKTKQFASDIPTGIGKGAAETAGTIAHGIHSVTGLPMNQEFLDQEKRTGAASPGEMAGKGLEGLMEYFGGDEILKSASLAKRLGLAAKVADLAETHPAISKLIEAGLNVVRGAGVSAGQSAVHAAPGEAGSEAATGAAFGATGEAGSELFSSLSKYLAPKTMKAVKSLVSSTNAAETANALAKATEAGETFNNAARNSVNKVLGYVPAEGGKEVPIRTFKDAADAIEKESSNLYQKIDSATGNKYSAIKKSADDAGKMVRRASSVEDLQKAEAAYATAKDQMDQLLNNTKGLSKDDVVQAKKTWRAQNVLNEIHEKIDRIYSLPQSAAEVAGVPREQIPMNLKKAPSALQSALRLPKEDLSLTLEPKDITNLTNAVDAANAAQKRTAQVAKESAQKVKEVESTRSSGRAAFSKLGPAEAVAGLLYHPALAGTVIHSLFAYPEVGAPVFKALGAASQPAAQVAKQSVTHIFNPATGEAEPIQ